MTVIPETPGSSPATGGPIGPSGRVFCLPPAQPDRLRDVSGLLARGGVALAAPDGEQVAVPPEVVDVLRQSVAAMLAGRAVMLTGVNQRITRYEAHDLFGISRASFKKMLDDGELEHDQKGRLRRVRLADLLEHRDRQRQRAGESFERLVDASAEMGLYDG